MTNREFAKQNDLFKEACEMARTEPTTRQASKFKRGMGLAWKALQDTTGGKEVKK